MCAKSPFEPLEKTGGLEEIVSFRGGAGQAEEIRPGE
jgi:hypothetical protein